MSRAFVKEPDGDQVPDDNPRPRKVAGPHWVTPRGLALLEAARGDAAAALAMVPKEDRAARQRALSRLSASEQLLKTAEVIDPAGQPVDHVRFGHAVVVRDDAGEEKRFTLVGEEEADFKAGMVAYTSPLGQALLGAQPGEVVAWIRPKGETELEILAIGHPA